MARRLARPPGPPARALAVPAVILGVLLATLVLAPAAARADGDPASDMLLAQSVFYPFTPRVSASLQRTLNAETAAAQRAGLPIKVALIASPADLGAIPQLFGRPQAYADFLDREISFGGPVPLLVVMAAGYGVAGFHTPAPAAAVADLHAPAGAPAGGRAADALARAAVTAIARVAGAGGHRLRLTGATAGSSGGGGSPVVIVIALAVAAVVAATAVIALRRRRPGPRRRPPGRKPSARRAR